MIPVILSRKIADPAPIKYGASLFITPSPQYCTSDASHLVPCVNGDLISSWFERASKTWVNWTSFGSYIKPTFNASGSVYDVSFSNNAIYQFANAWPSVDLSFTMRFIPQPYVGEIIGSIDSGNVPFNFYRATTTGPVQRHNTGPSAALANGSDTIISYFGTGTGAGSVEKLRVNGGAWSTVLNARPTRSGMSLGLMLAFGAAGATKFTGFKGLSIFPTGITDTAFADVEAYFSSL